MREHEFCIRNESPRERMRRIKRNIQIRKQRLYGTAFPVEEPNHTEPKEHSHKEDKGYLQKLKNRQAAQKSRQQKKMYVTQLEEQIKKLRQKMRHCPNCQNQLQTLTSEIDNTREETHSRQINETESFEDEIQQNQSQFYRVSSTSQDSSIGMYLFVFMVIIGVFCMGTRLDSADSGAPFKRDLMQTFNRQQDQPVIPKASDKLVLASDLQPIYHYQTNMNPTYSTNSLVDLDQSNYEHGLLSMDQVKSPASISDQKMFDKIITAFQNYKLIEYDEKHLRSKGGLIDANKSLMFCNRPKIYRSESNEKGILTTFLDIFVQGAQIVNILPQNDQNSLASGNLQLNGLYKITASVQEIEEVINPNFIY